MDNGIDIILSKRNYICPEPYIQGRIVEYDIKSANISMLKKYNVISNSYYEYLSKLPKYDREVEIGNRIRENRDIQNTIYNGIDETLKKFIQLNNISSSNIIRRANDALYINTSVDLKYTNIDGILVRQKSIYSSLLQLNKLLFLFYYNPDINVDVKGIKQDLLNLHNGYMITVIGTAILLYERSSTSDALSYLNNIIEDYLKHKLPVEYYRNLDSFSDYTYNIYGGFRSMTQPKFIDDSINIECNLNILRELYSILFNLYIKTT